MDSESRDDKTSQENDECSVLMTAHLLGKKWVIYVIAELMRNPYSSFNELQRKIRAVDNTQISARMLTSVLKHLEKEGIVMRVPISDTKPVRVKYVLTEKGEDLIIVFAALKTWGAKWGGTKTKKCRSFTCIHDLIPIIIDEKKLKESMYLPKFLRDNYKF